MPSETTDNSHALVVLCDRAGDAGAALHRLGAIISPNVRLIAAAPSGQASRIFAKARSLGCTHVIAISAADDYSPDCLAPLMLAAGGNPSALIVGHRACERPAAGLFLRACNMLLRLETGHRLRRDDGPRVYPVRVMQTIDPTGTRQFCEMEILVRSAWAACPIVMAALPAPADKIPPRRSRSIPLRRMSGELGMHVRLIARVLSGLRNTRYDAAALPAARQPFWRMFWRWLNPFDAWRELRQGGASRNEMAVGLAVGAFIGNMPVWGFHTAISLYVARRLHLNPLAVMSGSHASAPPMGPILVASAMWTGHVILHHSRPKWENITPFHGKFMANAPSLLLDWTLGAVLIGTALAIVVFVVANFLFRFVEKRKTDAPPLSVDVSATHS